MEAGRSYSYSTCGASQDTYLRIYGSNGYSLVASNDDNGPHCFGTTASVDFSPTTSGYYYLELARFSRNPLSSDVTLRCVYELSILGHDDEVSVYVDGIQQFSFNGCCTNHGVV